MNDDYDFTVTDYLQRLQVWSTVAARSGGDVGAVMKTAESYAAAVLVPVCGAAVQRHGTQGFDPDGVMLQRGVFRFQARRDLTLAIVEAFLPEQHGRDVEVTASCAGASAAGCFPPASMFALRLSLAIPAGAECDFRLELSSTFQPAALSGGSGDIRHFGCIVTAVEFS